VPDLDIFVNQFIYTDPIVAELAHRGMTHSLFFSIAAAPIFGWLITKLYTRKTKA
jgi:inner membrane protein